MRRVIIVAVAPAQELDVVGPLNVFTIANDVLHELRRGDRLYAPEVVSGGKGRVVAGTSGVGLVTSRRFDEVVGQVDSLLVAGGPGARAMPSPALIAWLRHQAGGVRRMGSVCTGAFVLAGAGLLDGHRVTTHWAHAAELARRYPSIMVDAAPIWIRDRRVYTSAGICAGLDLSLALVEEDHGSEVAMLVARHLVVYLRRPGDQAQFSTALAAQATERREFRDLAVWIGEHLHDDLRIPSLAERAAMSERTFCRLFLHEFGQSPGKYVERARYDAARHRLSSSADTLEAIAERFGFGSADVMRRVFRRLAGVTPAEYRQRFAIGADVPV